MTLNITSLAAELSVEPLGSNRFISKCNPTRRGNSGPIAYGGFTIGVAVQAAYHTVPSKYHLYSFLGHYLGPASPERKVVCTVHESRSTRTFMTRRVQVSQEQLDGSWRVCMEVLADFQVEEPPLLTYSTPPSRKYSNWRDCLDWDGTRKRLLSEGKLPQEESDLFQLSFGHLGKGMGYENRPCPEGFGTQTLIGAGRSVTTPQDHLPITSKTSADWICVNDTFQTQGQHIVALSFIMDGMLSFLPLTHGRMFFNDASDCSSLDFAFRLFTPHININNWHLRECITHGGAAGRTYSEGRLWDESGNLVASMSQQCILRLPKEKGKM